MSELRALTEAMRAIDRRISGVEDCLIILVRDSQQQAHWRHDQKNRAQSEDFLKKEQEIAIKQVQEACGAISHRLSEVVERLDNQSATRIDDVRRLNRRVGELEELAGKEVTKA